jgi:hypothetical protein
VKGNPPLGAQVLSALENHEPRFWDPTIRDHFQRHANFEDGMASMYDLMWVRGSKKERIHFSYCILSMAKYFSGWESTRDTLYSRLMRQLVESRILSLTGHNPDTSFVSLNYERLLEQAIVETGPHVLYHTGEPQGPDTVRVRKPHGSSNFVATAIKGVKGFPREDELDNHFVPVIRRQLHDLLELMKNELDLGKDIPPLIAMSLYMRDKPTMVGTESIRKIREAYEEDVIKTDLLIMIGVRPRITDEHLFNPILVGPSRILYIGRNQEGEEIKELKKFSESCRGTVVHVADSFEEALRKEVFTLNW